MSFLTKILGKDDTDTSDAVSPECTHASLVAHWDNPNDMGNEDLASSWKCTSCGAQFSSEDRAAFQQAELERVHQYQEESERVAQQREEADRLAS